MKKLTPYRLMLGGAMVFVVGLIVTVLFLGGVYDAVGDCLGGAEDGESCDDKSLNERGFWAQLFSRTPVIGAGLVVTGLMWQAFTIKKK